MWFPFQSLMMLFGPDWSCALGVVDAPSLRLCPPLGSCPSLPAGLPSLSAVRIDREAFCSAAARRNFSDRRLSHAIEMTRRNSYHPGCVSFLCNLDAISSLLFCPIEGSIRRV